MAEYIEKEALKNRLRAYNCTSTSDSEDYNRGLNDALRYVAPMIIAEQPAVDVAPMVHGRWIQEYRIEETYYSPDDFERYKVPDGFSCSICAKWNSTNTNNCPNCGARMDGDGNG